MDLALVSVEVCRATSLLRWSVFWSLFVGQRGGIDGQHFSPSVDSGIAGIFRCLGKADQECP